jgi:ferric-dicitrate binding protein FerR (iron transport regulator)
VYPVAHFRPNLRNGLALLALLFTVCAGLRAQFPPDPDGTARLMVFTGQVSVIRGGDGTLWALNLGDSVRPQEVVVTGPDGYANFKLADGSTFEVFANSKVVFRANRGDWRDLLEIMLGKVRVQIEHFGGLPNNNKVRTPSAVISVRGTIFDVEVEEVTNTTLVVDEEGSVEVRHLLRPESKTVVLTPGQFVRVYRDKPLARQIDKGGILERAMRAAAEVAVQVARQAPSVSHGTTTPPVTLPGSHGPTTTPPPPPPPPPPQ